MYRSLSCFCFCSVAVSPAPTFTARRSSRTLPPNPAVEGTRRDEAASRPSLLRLERTMTQPPRVSSEPYENWSTVPTSPLKRVLKRSLLFGAYAQLTLLFGASIWSLYGEFLFSAFAFLILLALFIDQLRRYGIAGLRNGNPLGYTFYLYFAFLISVSAQINAVVYIRLAW